MSKLAADNLRANALGVETPMIYAVRGSAKAWANLNGIGTIALRDSLNISGVVDHGTGDYSLNYTSAFDGQGYSPTSLARTDTNPTNNDYPIMGLYRGSSTTTTALRVNMCNRSAVTVVTTLSDGDVMTISVNGDLA